ncbi:hypothetical protein Rsub_04141 [Raphidocelis subcapitata]|uniref:Phosphatidic acid phosphatase type 2/haloperoxidase domain-containing protein n=1 Tax=Raphidocelis subcapitata TaxID=307507 RepID=A0A2V0NUV6_9CHLO|nr:hypothetical protein Rsub_04141 [Raphidocelis subcapitata]|eukprot:GBF91401.1 hypothetical protein Rsub_04141 [Raphidocelis subcapitata]
MAASGKATKPSALGALRGFPRRAAAPPALARSAGRSATRIRQRPQPPAAVEERATGAAAPTTAGAPAAPAGDRADAGAARLQAALCTPLAAAAFLGLAAATAAALAAPPLAAADAAAHAAVAAGTTAEWRACFAERALSNAAIDASLAGWALLTLAALAAAPLRAAAPLAVAWAAYAGAAGAVGERDPPLVAALKAAFARARPSNELHHSFSFPSGHATAAAFTAAVLLFALLPLAARCVRGRLGGGGGGGAARLPDAAAIPLWLAAWGATALGRVLSDSHWVSDTLAGGALGTAVALAVAVAAERLDSAYLSGGPGGGGAGVGGDGGSSRAGGGGGDGRGGSGVPGGGGGRQE